MDYMHKENICKQHESMINTQPKERETTLLYHSVTPSSHIYPSNHLVGVNMWREATMIWFELLSHVKEVQLMETHHTYI